MRELNISKAFKKDLKSIKSTRNYDEKDLFDVIDMLKNDVVLPEKYRDHSLTGNWVNHRDCHVKPDWVLIYKLEPNQLYLACTESHNKLFR